MENLHKAESDALRAYIDRAKMLSQEVYDSIVEIMKRHPNKTANFIGLDSSPIMFENYNDMETATVDEVGYNEEYNFIEVEGSSSMSNLTTLLYRDNLYSDLGLALGLLESLIEREEFLFNDEDATEEGE